MRPEAITFPHRLIKSLNFNRKQWIRLQRSLQNEASSLPVSSFCFFESCHEAKMCTRSISCCFSFLQVWEIVWLPPVSLRWRWDALLTPSNTTQRNISEKQRSGFKWHPAAVTISSSQLCFVLSCSGCLEIGPCAMKDCSSMRTPWETPTSRSPWNRTG